jgi:hypothetical protein
MKNRLTEIEISFKESPVEILPITRTRETARQKRKNSWLAWLT